MAPKKNNIFFFLNKLLVKGKNILKKKKNLLVKGNMSPKTCGFT